MKSLRYFDISWMSTWDGPGTRLTVFFQGCPLRCKWCHSPHSWERYSPVLHNRNLCRLCGKCLSACEYGVHRIEDGRHSIRSEGCTRCGRCIDVCPASSRESGGSLVLPTREIDVQELYGLLEPQLNLLKGIGGITLSGGEALLQYQAAGELLTLCKSGGTHTAVETGGLLPLQNYRHVSHLVDCWLIGIRGFDGTSAELLQLSQNIEFLSSLHRDIIVRLPVICGSTDSEKQLKTTADVMHRFSLREIQLLPYNVNTPHYYEALGLDFEPLENAAPDVGRLNEISKFFKDENFKVKIIL